MDWIITWNTFQSFPSLQSGSTPLDFSSQGQSFSKSSEKTWKFLSVGDFWDPPSSPPLKVRGMEYLRWALHSFPVLFKIPKAPLLNLNGTIQSGACWTHLSPQPVNLKIWGNPNLYSIVKISKHPLDKIYFIVPFNICLIIYNVWFLVSIDVLYEGVSLAGAFKLLALHKLV